MHALQVIKNVCVDALAEDNPAAADSFRAVVDPASVLELATMIESLVDYVEKIDDLTARELVTDIKHRMAGNVGADGGV